jgi:hypothetical protein
MRIFLILLLAGSAYEGEAQDKASATVYFMRSTGTFSLGSAFSIFTDDSLSCNLNNKSFSVHQLTPGLHRFQVRSSVTSKPSKKIKTVELNMEPGETYYFSVTVQRPVGDIAAVAIMEVTINTANKLLPELKQDTNCN